MPENLVTFDLNKLKGEIDSRKKEQTKKQVVLGTVQEGAITKNGKKAFLNELVTSMHTGIKTSASEAIKAVNETVETRRGVPQAVAKNVNRYIPSRTIVNEEVAPPVAPRRSGAEDWGFGEGTGGGNGQPRYRHGGDERDQMFDQEFNKQNAQFDQMMMAGFANNPAFAKFMQQQNQQPVQSYKPQVIAEGAMNEQVQAINEKMERNIERLVESTFKNVLTTIYTKERIQESLVEYLQTDEGLKVVGRAINEIAKRNKAKQQGK